MQVHVCAAWDAKCCIDSCAVRWGTCEALLRGNGRFLDGHAAAWVPDDFGSLGPKQCHVIRDGDQSPSCCPAQLCKHGSRLAKCGDEDPLPSHAPYVCIIIACTAAYRRGPGTWIRASQLKA